MKIAKSNKIIHGLWIGKNLSNLELLTINSFIYHGHEFHLWVYDVLETVIPSTVVLKDANEIMPCEKVFHYENTNQFGHGKGSVAGFSDIFRYKLLYEKGGWWVDMDITCLRPFDFEDPYVFREHGELKIVGNVLKCPAKSQIMKSCYEEALATVDSKNKNWFKPIEILNTNLIKYNLEEYIQPNISFPDHFGLVQLFKGFKIKIPETIYFIHWLNEEWRNNNIDKSKFKIKSSYGQYMIKYGVVQGEYSNFELTKNYAKTLNPKLYLYKLILFTPPVYYFIRNLKWAIRKHVLLRKRQIIGKGLSPNLLVKLKLIQTKESPYEF